MLPMLIVIFVFWALSKLVASFCQSDAASRERFKLLYNFISLYEQKTGIRLTTDQAIALIQVTMATMARDPGNKVYLDERYPNAQRLTDRLCAEAERKVLKDGDYNETDNET